MGANWIGRLLVSQSGWRHSALVQLVKYILVIAGLCVIAAAAFQVADVLGYIEVRSYPFLKSDSSALKWSYAVFLALFGTAAIVMALTAQW